MLQDDRCNRSKEIDSTVIEKKFSYKNCGGAGKI